MEVGDAIEEVRGELAGASSEFMASTCSLIAPTRADDGFSGHKKTEAAVASNIPCWVESASGGYQVNDGGSVVTKSHRITIPVTADTIAIKRHYKIKINASGTNAEMMLDQPIVLLGDMDPLMSIWASEAKGYNQPAMQ